MEQNVKQSYVVFGIRDNYMEVVFTDRTDHPRFVTKVENPFAADYFTSRGFYFSPEVMAEFWNHLRERCYAAFADGMFSFQTELFAFMEQGFPVRLVYNNKLLGPKVVRGPSGKIYIIDALHSGWMVTRQPEFAQYGMEFNIALDDLTQACKDAGHKYSLRQMMGRLLSNDVVSTTVSGDLKMLDLAPTREQANAAIADK